MFMNIREGTNMRIRIYNEDECPVCVIEGCKVIFINRSIQEIKRFFSLLNQAIIKDLDKISIQSPQRRKIDYKLLHEGDTILIRIAVRDSCVVIPRNSNTREVAIVFSNSIDIKISTFFRGQSNKCYRKNKPSNRITTGS